MIIMLRGIALVAGRVLAISLEKLQDLERPAQTGVMDPVPSVPVRDNETIVSTPGYPTQMDALYDMLEEK